MSCLGKKRCQNLGKQAQLQIEQLESRLVPASYVWNTDSDGFWNNDANWSPNGVPGLGDSVTIDRGAANPTITITDDRTISNLDLREKLVIQSGTVVCAGPWSLAGDSSFASTLEIAQGGTMALRGGSVGGDYRPAFTNAGTIIVGSGNQNLSGMPLTNLPTGVISWEDGATLLGNSHLINQGTFLKPAGTGTSALTKTWSNRGGTIQVDAGTLEMTNTMADVSGMRFVVAQGAKAFLSGDLRNWSGVISGTGSGLVQFGDANRRATVTLSTNDSSPADATFNFSPGMAHITNCWIQSIGVQNVPNGVLSNQGTLVFDQAASDIRLTTALTINNSGSMIIANAAGSSMYLQTTTIINTGLIDFTNNSTVTIGYSSATIQNRGRLLKSAGSGVTTVGGVIMRPEGTVESRTGTLELRGFGGAPASTGGAFAASNGATILLTENHYLQGSYSGTGLGTVQIGTSDTSYPNATIRVEQAGASLNFTDSILHFVRGLIYSDNIQNVGFSTITNNGIISIDGGEANFSGFASINNPGSIIVSASGQLRLFNATLRNQTGGLLEFRGGGGAVGSGVIDNRGILRQSTGLNVTISTPVILRKEGLVDVVGGGLDLAGDNSVLEGGSYQVAAGGELKATGFSPTLRGDFTGSGGGRFTLTRDMTLEGASFDFPAGMVRFTGGSLTAANNGRAEFVNRGFMTIASGGSRQRSAFTRADLRNLGTITVNDAEWLPDGSTTIDNRGTIDLSDGAIVLRSTGSITNRGRILKSGTGTASFLASLDNQGTVEVPQGTLTFSQFGSTAIQNYSTASGGTLTGGTWKVSGAGILDLGGLDNNSTDPVSVISGATVMVDGTAAVFDGLGSLKSNAGTLVLSGGADLGLTGNDFVNAGLLGLGSGSVLSVKSFTQTATGGLGIGIGGLPSDGRFGKVAATQGASLAGALKVEIEGGFGITAGQTYSFLAATSFSGQFDSVTGLKLGRVTLMELRPTAATRDLATLLPAPDIAASSVTAISTSGFAGESITIDWTVSNIGGTDAAGTWSDSVYLSTDDAIDRDDILVGRLDHSGGLAAGASYTRRLTAKIPAVSGSYKVIVVADGQARLSDINRANNASAEASFRVISYKPIAPGASESVPLAAGGVAYRQVTLAAGQSVQVEPPSGLTGSLLFASARDGAPDLATRLPAAESLPVLAGPGTFVVAIVAGPGYTASAATITMAPRPLAVTGIDTTRVGAGGIATIAIRGSAFQAGATVSLVDPDTQLPVIQATTVRVVDESTIMATFNLASATTGRRKVRVDIDSSNTTSASTVEVTPAATASFSAQVITPESVRPRVPFDGKVVITNNGTSDALVPLLSLSQSAPFKFVRSGDGWMNLAGTLQLVAHPGDGRNFLRPGESVVVPFRAYADTAEVHVFDTITLSVVGADSNAAFDPATIDAAFADSGNLRPAAIALMKTRVGTTAGSYVSYLAGVAAQAASLGVANFRVDELLQIAIREISAKDILASARGKLAGVSAQVAQTRGLNLLNLDSGDSYPAVIALDGTFAFHGVPKGFYTLKSDGFGILPTRIVKGDSMATLGTVNAVTYQPLEGTVINGSTGRAVSGAKVVAELAGQVITSETDSRGMYSLLLQPSVAYNLTVSKDGLTELSTQLAVTAPTNRDFTLETGRIISGVVKSGDNPVGGATVTLTGGGSFRSATTASDGTYSFTGLGGASFELQASTASQLSQVQSVTFTNAQSSISAGVLGLQTSVALTGTVTTGATPATTLRGILVGFKGPDGRVRTTTTDSLGQYTLRVLPNQGGTLFSESPGFLQFRTSANSGATGLLTNISLQALGSVSGAVTNGTAPVAGATIRLTSASPADSYLREVKTTSSGAYSVGSLPDGNYILEWVGNPLAGARQAITISGHQPVTANIQVAGCQIAGAVQDIANIPSTGYPFIVLSGGQAVYSGSTDPMGRYSVEVTAAGTYRILAQTGPGTWSSVLVEVGASDRQLLGKDLTQGQASRPLLVTNGTGQPVSGATVEARLGGLTLSTTTDSAGRGSFAGMIPEAVSLVVLANGGSAVLASVNLTGATDLPVQLTPNGSLEANDDGFLSSGFQGGLEIVAVRLGTRITVSRTSDGSLGGLIGRWSNYPAGDYRVYVYAGSLGDSPSGRLLGISSATVPVAAGQLISASIQSVELTRRAIRLTDQNGNGLGNAVVTIKTDDGTIIDTEVTDSAGLVSVSCPPSFVPCQLAIDINGATRLVSTNLQAGANGEVGVTVALAASGLVPQPSYSATRGIIFPSVQNDLVEPYLPPAPAEDDPCYNDKIRYFIAALREILNFRSARDETNRQWEALSAIEKATYGELASRATIAGLKLVTATASIANGFNAVRQHGNLTDELLQSGLSKSTADSVNMLGTMIGNYAEVIGSAISDSYDPELNGKASQSTILNLIGALAAQGVSIFQLAEQGLTDIGYISDKLGKAVPVIDSIREILLQILEVRNIKYELDRLTDDLRRFNNYSTSQDLYFTAYRRANHAVKAYNDILNGPSGSPCPPPPPPPPPPKTPYPKTFPGPQTLASLDPNDILGPAGVGDQKFVAPSDTFSYTIRFENAPTATAPASVVTLTQVLDPDLDASSVRFVGAGFADVNLSHGDARFVNTRYDDRAVSGLFVDLDGYVDIPTRTIHWSFTSIDPLTGEAPADASLGFLAINNAAHAGEGYITYSVKAVQGSPHGARLDAAASIVFDTNPAISTPPIFNTIDSAAPVPGSLGIATIAGQADSKALVLLGARPITLKWSAGTDNGSGVANQTLQVSSDGGTTFTDVVANTSATSAPFTPDVGTRYRFRLLATDRVGNQTSPPLGSFADLYVTGSSGAILRRNGDSIEAAVSDTAPAFLTRLASDMTSIDFLGTDAAANSLGIKRSAGGGFSTPVRFFGGEAVPVAPTGSPSFAPPDIVTITGLEAEDASFKFSGYQVIRATISAASIDVIGAESLSLASAKSVLLQTSAGDDFASITGGGNSATFNLSGPSAGTAVAFSSVPAVTIDLGFGDSASNRNSFALTTSINAAGLKSVSVLGGAGTDTFSLLGNSSTSLPVSGGGVSFNGNGGTDAIRAEANANWTLTDSLITSSLGHRVALASVKAADLTGGAGNNILDATLFTGTTALQGGLGNDILKGGKGRDTVREYGDRATSFTLTNTRLTGLGTDTLSGIEDADLVGGPGNNTFDLSLFTGTATVDCFAGGTDTVKGGRGINTIKTSAGAGNFTVSATRVAHPSGIVNFTSVEKVELFGGASANTFDVSTYTGSTILHGGGGNDTVVATRDASFTLSDSLLSVTGGGTHTLDGIKAARLTGGAGANTFTIGAWTGQATLNGSAGTDTLVASGDFNFTLGAASLSVSSGASVAFAAIEKARLTGGNSANTLDASLFAGSVILLGLDGNDTLRGARGASVLVGGNGDDSLVAGTGRSILIGGTGADSITGGVADDLIIHGSTRYDANTAALDALLAEWSRNTATYAQRVTRLRTGVGGLNGANKLTGAVTDDLATDSMSGGAGQDWFFARVTAPADILSDRAANENLN